MTWPLATVFAFIIAFETYLPQTRCYSCRREKVRFPFHYQPRLSWGTYESLLNFAERIQHDLRDLHPKDMIDIQSFIWLQGSDEYEEGPPMKSR